MSYKAYELAAELQDELSKRLSSLAVVLGQDTNGDPTIAIGAGTPGGKNAFIRVKAIDWPGTDALGLTQTVFTPHVIQIATEANYAAAIDGVADNLTPTELLPLLLSVGVRGTQVEWYVETYGTAPTVSSLAANKLSASYSPSAQWGLKAQQ
jgi:hypothetical protein